MYDFHVVFTNTQPLRDELEVVEKELNEKLAMLAEKQKMVAEINDKLAKL